MGRSLYRRLGFVETTDGGDRPGTVSVESVDVVVGVDQHQCRIGWERPEVDVSGVPPFLFGSPIVTAAALGPGGLFERVVAHEVRVIPIDDRAGSLGE